MDENPYESPREAGYRAPQQPTIDAYAKDRLLLLVTASVAFVAMMGLAVVLSVVTEYFPALNDPEVHFAMFLCIIALVVFVVCVRRR